MPYLRVGLPAVRRGGIEELEVPEEDGKRSGGGPGR